VNVADSNQATGAGAVGGATTIVQPRGATDDVGLMDASGAAISGAAQSTSRPADDDVGLMDPTGAAVQDDETRPPRFRGR
jgi:hypothetical protein